MKITVNLEHKSYDILLKKDILHEISKNFDLNRKVMVITDNRVPSEYLDAVLSQCSQGFSYTIENGENSKNLENYQKILEYMLEKSFTRKDLVIALGGGVIGDLSGFVSASYMRGIEYISVPTTTLSQIDSSIGGKTAVNLGKVKNIIGAFHHPSMVFIDPNTLKTLSKRHFYNGLVEALKAGLIYDCELFEMFLNDDIEENLVDIIYKSLLVKKDVVEKDEKEQNLRKILNLGHTIGHGIESFYNFELYHGECVALGMMPMLKNNEIREKTKQILHKMDIKTEISYDLDTVFEIVKRDKKAGSKTISIITVENLGSANIEEVTFETVLELMKGH